MAVGLKPPERLVPVKGVCLATAAAEIRYSDREDMLLLHFAEGSAVGAVFTQNKFCAAPIIVAKEHLESDSARVLLINSGNANAGTGETGILNTKESCRIVAKGLKLRETQILPFSTGVIGEQLPMDKMGRGCETLLKGLTSEGGDWLAAAESIMTTDTIAKALSEQVEIDGQQVTITGIAKGSGMIAPNMATMLSFVTSDAAIDSVILQEMLISACDVSFNRITVDSDTSTNDALVFAATGKSSAPIIDTRDSPNAKKIYAALETILIGLATSIVRDAEGASKFVKVSVHNGGSETDCEAIAYSVANSPLVKTALFASDPNWGRLLMAIGKADVAVLDVEQIDISINGLAVVKKGQSAESYSEDLGQAEFSKEEIEITIDLHAGEATYHVWTSDLSSEYVSINADYRS